MEEDTVTQFMSISGLPANQSQMYLDMAGGSLEVAISLFYEQGAPAQGNDQGNLATATTELTVQTVLWPNKNEIPNSWKIQGLEFDEQNPLGLKQHENGPCGPLAVINAVLISQLLKKENFSLQYQVTPQDLTNALIEILNVVREDQQSKYQLCTNLDDLKTQELVDEQQARDFITSNLQQYQSPGGLVLFIYSILLTKGLDKIKNEVLQSGGELPLIVKPFYICVTDLLMLMLTGIANGNVGDFDPLSEKKIEINNKLQIGLLSSSVHEMKIPINNALLSPSNSVLILHGGEHFTTMFTTQSLEDNEIIMYQWNGLKPGGPRMCQFKLTSFSVKKENPAPKEYKKTHQEYRPEIGEIESIIQARPEDKQNFPKQYQKWTYEVALIMHEEQDSQYPSRPQDVARPQVYEQGPVIEGPWKCMYCYPKRYQTMCFGQNEAGATACQHCQKARDIAGWSIYLHYNQLPGGYQASQARIHGPKITGILETKWKGIKLEFLDQQEPPTI